MRIWLSGPRMFGGLVRPGVSFGREDLRAIRSDSVLSVLIKAIVAIPLMLVLFGCIYLIVAVLSS